MKTSQVFHYETVDADHIRLTPEGEPMKIDQVKPSIVLVFAGWTSVFLLCWLLLLRVVPVDALSLSLLFLFFFLGVMASAVYSGKPRVVSDVRVRIGDKLITEEDGNLKVLKQGKITLCIINPDVAEKAIYAGLTEKKA